MSKVRLNGTDGFFHFFRDKAEFQKSSKLKGHKSSSSLCLCLFEVLKVCYLQDQPQTDIQTDRQTDKVTTITLLRMRAGG